MNNSREKKKETKNKESINSYNINLNSLLNDSKFQKYFEKNIQFLENFELLEFIGSGSESEVYKVNIKSSKKTVAMKMISIKKNENKNINEINISKKLKNKNIINYYLSYEIEKNEAFCIIMDYGKHGNLIDFQKNLLSKNYLSESILCFLTYQILNGLKYIHMCKITHFDLKPQNIIVDEYLNIKIIDFSISLDYKKIDSNEIKLPFRGTSFYMAPEVLKSDTINKKDLNKVDLYSLGIILYYLAFGFYPFELNYEDAKKYDIIYNKILKDLKFENEDNYYSSHFIEFVTKLLEKDINKRININEALNHYWVKGANILFEEKEKTYNASNFLGYLVTDHFKNFDDYIQKK